MTDPLLFGIICISNKERGLLDMGLRVKCKVTKKIFNNGDFYIYGCSPIPPFPNSLKLNNYFNFSIKGDLSYITEGKEYELDLEEMDTTKFGTSYKVVGVPSVECADLENLSYDESMEILTSFTTERQAKSILDAYPDFIHKILEEGKGSIDTKQIYGVGEAYLSAYSRELNVRYKYLAIMNKFKEWQFDVTDCKNLVEEYGKDIDIKKALTESPYHVFIDVLRRPFNLVDNLIIDLRPDLKKSNERCTYLILSVLERAELDGDSKLDANSLYNYIMNEYPQAQDLHELIVPVVKESEHFYYNDEEKMVARMETYLAEKTIADFVVNKIKNSTKLDIDYTKYTEIKDGTLTEEQQNILKTFCESNITVVDAIGGTGKTASTMALIEMLEDNNMTYSLLAPTGKVAKVLKEATNGRATSTIHKAVLSNPDGLSSDVFVVEEASMIGIDLMCMLINSITNPNARIIFNMDIGQIASISCGCPLRDVINSKHAPVCNLTKVFRYGEGGLYKMATDAYNKKFYINQFDYSQDRVSVGKNKDYTYVRYNGEVSQIIEEYKNFIKRGIKPIDIAVITPWNVTDFGTINLSNEIQALVNPPKENEVTVERTVRKQKVKFRVGDIILNTKNTYNALTLDGYQMLKSDSVLTKEDVAVAPVMNGEIGKIVDIDDGNIIAQFDEHVLVFDRAMQNNILLAYSLTSYKMQGSQCPYVITLITPQFEKSLNKNIVYTDMSRTRKEVVEIIDPNTLASIIGTDNIQERLTNLGLLLDEGMGVK